jgi:transcriptional regulator with XRE-family HTH domain
MRMPNHLHDVILYCRNRATFVAKMAKEPRSDSTYWQRQEEGWLALAASYEINEANMKPNEAIPKTLAERLAWLLRYRGRSALSVSRAANLGATNVSQIINGQSKNPQIHNLESIVAVLDSSVDFLMGRTDDPERVSSGATSTGVPTHLIPIVGIAEAGVYRSAAVATSIDDISVFAIRSTQWPDARHFAIIIHDEQMTALQPQPLMPGMTALLVDFNEIGGEIETGRIYYITRVSETPSGVIVEKALWLAKVSDDIVEFRAASANPKINSGHRFTVPRGSSFQDSQVVVEGRLYGYQGSYEEQLANGPD